MLADHITSEQTPETTRSVSFPWEGRVAIVALYAHFWTDDGHLSTAEAYLVWESTTFIAMRFVLLSVAIVCSFSAIRRSRSPSLFLTVPCFIICCLYTLYWLDYLIRWIFMYHPNPY
jgi:hypothetical protein